MKRIAGGLLALSLWIIVLRAPFYFTALGPDEGLFLTVAKQWLGGARLYTDVWDNKPPGIFIFYAAIIRLFGCSVAAVAVAAMLAVLFASVLVGLAARTIAGADRAGAIAAFVLPAYTLDLGGGGGNTELFMMVPQSLAVWLLARHMQRQANTRGVLPIAVAFGLLQGLLIELKFPVVFESASIGGLFATWLFRSGRGWVDVVRFAAVAAASGGLIPACVFVWFAANGGLADLIFANFISPRLYVVSPFGLNAPLHSLVLTLGRVSYFWPLLAAGVIFGALTYRDRGAEQGRLACWLPLAWAAGGLAAACSAGYFRYYYFIALVPPLTLVGALAMDGLMRLPAVERRLKLRPMILAVTAGLLLTAYPLEEDLRKLPRQMSSDEHRLQQSAMTVIRKLNRPNETAFLGDLNAGLYSLTGLKPVTRYPQANAHVFDLPERFGVDPVGELTRIFDRRPDIVMGRIRYLGPSGQYADTIRPRLAADYETVRIDDEWLANRIVVYRRKQRTGN